MRGGLEEALARMAKRDELRQRTGGGSATGPVTGTAAVVTNGGQRPDTTWLTHGADDPWASDVSMG